MCAENCSCLLLLPELACDPTATADLAAVIMQEGIAHVCLVTGSMTLVRAKIETSIPRKRKGMCGQHDKVRSYEHNVCNDAAYRSCVW